MVVIDESIANAIFDIVVEECGAMEFDRRPYIRYAMSEQPLEYRFGGDLGFGGKIYHNGYRVYVSCYIEHITPERNAKMARANARLVELLDLTDDD